jgi:hypothetical protein
VVVWCGQVFPSPGSTLRSRQMAVGCVDLAVDILHHRHAPGYEVCLLVRDRIPGDPNVCRGVVNVQDYSRLSLGDSHRTSSVDHVHESDYPSDPCCSHHTLAVCSEYGHQSDACALDLGAQAYGANLGVAVEG